MVNKYLAYKNEIYEYNVGQRIFSFGQWSCK